MPDSPAISRDKAVGYSGPTSAPTKKGLKFPRFYTTENQNPLDMVEWTSRSAIIRNEKGDVIFEQTGIEAPVSWSDMAVNVVASRYFRGAPGRPERESGVKSLLLRVVNTLTSWGEEQGYFASNRDQEAFHDELLYLLLNQKASFNSPVWFNVGAEPHPQCSACFILDVDDNMESILAWYAQEGMIFKGGSGAGINVSKLRSCKEPLSGGGTASGPLSFMRAADASAGVIKSGGKTRRAAKMVILNIDHPDILDFVRSKSREERKARALIREGYDPSFEGEAYASVAFQNANHSVRVPDAFMEAEKNNEKWQTRFVVSGDVADTRNARDLLREISEAAHACGDPGLQFDTAINNMHTCPDTAPIRASNPCSEYMHLDNSACNLSSLRITAFLDKDGFALDAFCHAVDVMITAQDIIVDKAAYPTETITRNSSDYRSLGLGYADLGSLLMSLGLPYDSEEGRALAGVITAILTGEAYSQSARIAAARGPFRGFEKNREAMLRVIRTHQRNLDRINASMAPEELVARARETWKTALESGEAHGYANAQVTVLAPTGTVAFMMDCDTTGVEPEIALIKYKKLSGGGRLKIVNRTVARALEKLGYSTEVIPNLLEKIEETGTIEGIEEVAPEHLPVFDCAFRPLLGKRFISPKGHLRMMSAIQPFISGAISKTVNLPADTTVEQIEDIFRMAWRLGLKSIAVYRDGCKGMQPVGLSGTEAGTSLPVRRRLPIDCKSVRHKFNIAGQRGYIHTGFYDDGKVGEIFIRMAKEGSTISGLMDTIATLTSISLQYGVPLEALVYKFSHMRFEPSGFTGNPQIPIAKSLIDYIFRYLGFNFLRKEEQQAAGLLSTDEAAAKVESAAERSGSILVEPAILDQVFNAQSDAPACRDCGAIMVRNGSCYTCLNCGSTTGCS
jgi:ribonucleoside-diphosphate reductase alpha chain